MFFIRAFLFLFLIISFIGGSKLLTANDLMQINSRPNFADVDLFPLSDVYHQSLYPNVYEFELSSGETIKLKFDLDKFCHLIALAKTLGQQRTLSWGVIKQHKGIKGWHGIREGRVSKATIRSYGVSLNTMKEKVIHFYYLPRLLQTGTLAIKFVPSGGTRIPSEIIIYDYYSPDNAFIQLGITMEYHKRWYYPETFLIERKTPAKPDNKFAQPPSTVVAVKNRKIYSRFYYPHRIKIKSNCNFLHFRSIRRRG